MVSLSAVVAALPLHVGFAPTLTRDQPGRHVGPGVAQPPLQGPVRVTATRCGHMTMTLDWILITNTTGQHHSRRNVVHRLRSQINVRGLEHNENYILATLTFLHPH